MTTTATPRITEDTAAPPHLDHEGVLDVHEVLEIAADARTEGALLAALFVIAQQGVAQLAAIRELIEAEHAVLVARRRNTYLDTSAKPSSGPIAVPVVAQEAT